MIYYFTATGNDQHVAERIAEATGDRLASITECLWNGTCSCVLEDGEGLGFVVPTYFGGLPSVVVEFLERLSVEGASPYVFLVSTFGTGCGGMSSFASSLLEPKGLSFDATFGVKMPDTWTPVFDLSSAEEVAAMNAKADGQIGEIAEAVAGRVRGHRLKSMVPWKLAKGMYEKYYKTASDTARFSVGDACTSCGLCERQCPTRAIELQGGRPAWVRDRCAVCLGCLHRCPAFAIQYNGQTQDHGQYVHPGVRLPG